MNRRHFFQQTAAAGLFAALAAKSGSSVKAGADAKKPLLHGLISAVFTPFKPDGTPNIDDIPKYVDYLVDAKMNGMYICGSTGEGPSLSVAERKALDEAFVKAAGGRITAVVQVGANAESDCQELAAHAESLGADAISANAPSYFKIRDTETMAQWLIDIASAAPNTPIYYYHIPSLTGVDIDMGVLLAEMEKNCPTFRGVKFSDTIGHRFLEITQYGGGKYEALWGCDESLLTGFALGGCGGIGSTYALAPKLYLRLLDAIDAGDWVKARKIQLDIWKFVQLLFKHKISSASRLILERAVGIKFGKSRLPLSADAAEVDAEAFDADLAAALPSFFGDGAKK
ncbi:MAG: dihydrodipicolinate synthase family protein [Thermoguttaceae bacterium]|nr:dihydrodipicolinate synthase family protein [Thermoguttaceae bacterium]MBQ3332288.1 dihydrodipicolinate synthase family protein [Thermoguttaceae bacterium]MBQ6619756.1 dihydrodipicolinate synthase family protein [Thermoguttaceae bacterium]